MKKKLIKNLEIKILSLVLAVLLWALVMNISDPEESRTIENLPVTVINEDAIAEADKVYTIVSGDTVDITIRGPQSVVRSVSASDFTAIADLSKTSVVGAVIIDVRVSAQYEDDLTITTGRRNDAVMIISLEDKKTESFRVNVRIQDEVLDNYYVMTDETRSTPNLVEVTGAVSKVDDIMEVVAEVSVQWRSASFTTQTTLKAYNSYGYEVDGLEFDTEEVEVAVSIVPTKEVEVEVVPEGIAYYGYTTERIENDPKVITIAGEQEALDKYAIFRPSFNISGWQDENGDGIMQGEIDLQEIYGDQMEEDGVVFVNEDTKVAVRVTFQKEGRQRILLRAQDIEVRDLPDNVEGVVSIDGAYTTTLEITGYMGEDRLTAADIHPYVVLVGSTIGETYRTEVRIDPDIPGVTKDGSCIVSVTLVEKQSEE